MNANKTYKRKRSSSTSGKKSSYKAKRYKGYPKSKKTEDMLGKATFQKQLVIDDRQMIKLKYVDIDTPELSVIAGSATSQVNTYNLNGLYDVNQSILSTTVPGFLEWGTFYRKYRVKGVKIEAEFLSETNGANIGILMHAQPSGGAVPIFTSWASLRKFEANPYTRKGCIGTVDGGGKCKLSMYVDLGKLNGNDLQWGIGSQYQGNFSTVISTGTNPSNIATLYIVAYKMDGTIATANFNAATMDLTMKFYVECDTRLDLQS